MPPDAVDLLLRTLRFQQAQDGDELRSSWSGVQTRGLPELVQYERSSLWLHRRLADLGLLDAVDPTLTSFLRERARWITAQNLRVEAQLDAIVRFLNARAVPHVLLKGSALRLLADRYPHGEARPAGDVDVLVPADLADSVWEWLRAAGFHRMDEHTHEDHHHLAPLSDRRGVTVELHTSTSKRVSPSDAWSRMNEGVCVVPRAGGVTKVPSATELLWHALAHAHVKPRDAFRLRFFQDAAAIMASTQDIDWDRIARRLEGSEIGDHALARRWLGAAAWLAARREPEGLLGRVPPFNLSSALKWRLSVLRRFTGGSSNNERSVWAADPVSRSRRLLIDQGTAADLRLGLSPPLKHAAPIARAGIWLAAAGARLCYRSWQLISRA